MTGITRPTGEQLRFNSSSTGSHILDDYLEAAEIGGRRLDELLSQLFDPSGNFDASLFEFRVDPTGGLFEFRVGQFIDPEAGWASTGQTIFNPRGDWASAQTYARLDCVSHANEFYICVTPHTSTASFDATKWSKVLDQNPLNVAVDTAEFYANQAIAAAASITGAVNIPIQTFAGTGAQTNFTLTLQPSSAEALLVTVDNIVQQPTVAYTVAGNTLTFTTAPANGTAISVRYLGGTLNQMPVQTKAATFTLSDAENFSVLNCTANLTINCQPAATAGNGFLTIVKTNGNSITVDPNSTEQIDGLATKVFTSDFFLWCDGSAWLSFAPAGGGGAVASVFGRSGAVVATAGDYTASQITNTPAGTLAATTVQAALNELDSEKAAIGHNHDSEYALISHVHDDTDIPTLGNAIDDRVSALLVFNEGLDSFYSDPTNELTISLDLFTDTTMGGVPASGGGTTNFLRADGTWAAPPGGGGISDGDKGDITVSAGGATWTLDAAVVTNAKLANMATQTIKGRNTAGSGDPEDLSVATVKTMLNLAGSNTGDQTITLTGDVTGTGTGSFAATIANDAVTNAKLANVATATLKGRATAGTGDPEDLTGTQATALLDTFTSTLKGLVPASGGGTSNYLRADGTWASPAGGSADGTLLDILIYTASGSFTKATYSGLQFVIAHVVGAGGGGAGCDGTASQVSRGSAGGAGAYAWKKIAAASLSTSETVTVGTGGAGGAAGANDGSPGGTSSFGAHITCTGGAQGITATAGTNVHTLNGGEGGTATGGDVNIPGSPAEFAVRSSSGTGNSGNSGAGPFGGAVSGTNGTGDGVNATAPGAGGGSSQSKDATNYAGGNGADGIVIVYVYGTP
jgi:hypothetical protein